MIWPDEAETRMLLDHVERQEDGAADALWARHREGLRRAISNRLDPALARRVDASDVVQDVMIKANQRLPDYLRNPALPFHLWLRQIARDHVIDQHRKHRIAARRSLDRERSIGNPGFHDRSSLDLAARLRDPALTPAAEALRHELRRRFEDAILRLEDDDREVIVLRHFEQLSNGEVAKVLGLSEPAAGMRHLRALRKLRVILGESPSLTGKETS